ncbi:MAG: cell division protein SepF [Propionibacteriaceae bacterium]|jgi:cell division inhibitor SepF|nr:cell division protein SepF [Propionibacteriaceae bacterium]
MGRLKNVGVWLGLSVPDEAGAEERTEAVELEPVVESTEAVPEVEPEPVVELSEVTEAAASTSFISVEPERYADAKEIGDNYKLGFPVIVDLEHLPVADARRLVDFSAGLTYCDGGTIERINKKFFLLTPPDADVDPEQLAALRDQLTLK